MENRNFRDKIISFDDRRNLIIPGNQEETIHFCAHHFLHIAQEAITKNGVFTVALSGGTTPNAIFSQISKPQYANVLDWSKVLCFWSDERSVSPQSSESNYFNAMKAGLAALPLLKENIFRMHAEIDIEKNAHLYELLIQDKVPASQFDLIMLGMGEDGHTASLFPKTEGLHTKERLVVANYVPQKQTWRMTLTYPCIERAKNICLYVLGENKADMVAKVFLSPYDPDNLPVQKVGTISHQSLWIMDVGASKELNQIRQLY